MPKSPGGLTPLVNSSSTCEENRPGVSLRQHSGAAMGDRVMADRAMNQGKDKSTGELAPTTSLL